MAGEYLRIKDQRRKGVGVWNQFESVHVLTRWVYIILHYTQTRGRKTTRGTRRWKRLTLSGDGSTSTLVRQLTSNPLAISMSRYQGTKLNKNKTIAIISALIVLVRSPECLLNRVIAVEIWIFNNRKRLERSRVWGEQQSVWTRWANEGN